jgi:hypothetical protein
MSSLNGILYGGLAPYDYDASNENFYEVDDYGDVLFSHLSPDKVATQVIPGG